MESQPVEFFVGFPFIESILIALIVICSNAECFEFFSGLTYNQLNNNLTSQAATMQTHGLPNDVLSNFDPMVLIILIPVCDLVVILPLSFLFSLMTYDIWCSFILICVVWG